MTTLTTTRPLPELYAEAAVALEAAIPTLIEIVQTHPVPCCFLVAHTQSCIGILRQRAEWLRSLSNRVHHAEASS